MKRLIENALSYGSRLNYDSSSEMTTICLLYDTVVLPHRVVHGGILRVSEIDGQYTLVRDDDDWDDDWSHEDYEAFYAGQTKELIEAGVVRRASPPDNSVSIADAETLFKKMDSQLIELLLQNAVLSTKVLRQNPLTREFEEQPNESYKSIPCDLVRNCYRKDHNTPLAFSSSHSNAAAKLHLAASAFRLVVPGVGSLRPNELLELREKTKDNREGFSAHIQELSGDLELMIRSGATEEEIKLAAEATVRTRISPRLSEFERQLHAIKAERKSGWVQVISSFLQIDSAPWSPKFFGQILQSLGALTQESVEQIVERNSNANLSLIFLSKLRNKS